MNQVLPAAREAAPHGVPHTILGQRPTELPIGGVIRPGIQVLTKSARENPKAVAIYEQGVAAGKDFETIEKEIMAAVPGMKKPLVPKNAPYFTVRRADFPMPELADMILKRFGEDRGDGLRLYRFPVWFASDAWQQVIPHSLKCYTSRQLKYWSEYSADGRTRFCMTRAPVDIDPNTKRPVRLFGGRKTIPRPENGGVCDPERCPEYQARQCNLSGNINFFIPGLPSLKAITMPTTSFYSLSNIRKTLEMVAFARGGRISGFLANGKSFWLTKKLHEVAMIDKDGNPTRAEQLLIELEADIDVGSLLLAEQRPDMEQIADGNRAVDVLTGEVMVLPASAPDADGLTPPAAAIPATGTTNKPLATCVENEGLLQELSELRANMYQLTQEMEISVDDMTRYAMATWQDEKWSRSIPLLKAAIAHLTGIRPVRGRVLALLKEMGVQMELFRRYAEGRYDTPLWAFDRVVLEAIEADLGQYRSDPEAFLVAMENELEPF
jgi:hypothetical protein